MSRSVTVLVPDPAEAAYEGRWQAAFERYRAVFAKRGIACEATPWTHMGESAGDVTLAELAWGYHRKAAAFEAGLRAWPQDRVLVNTTPLLLWNMCKIYLAELAEAGVPVIPTRFVDDPDATAFEAAFEAFAVDELVVKPQVSAGAHQTLRLARGTPLEASPTGSCMIQPFLPAVGGEGELSLFLFGDRLAYAVRKVAAAGDFRIQPQYGGRLSLFEPDAEAQALAAAAVAALPCPSSYARCDMVRGLDGHLQLMEVECIEPDLYLELAPDGGEAFVDAVLSA